MKILHWYNDDDEDQNVLCNWVVSQGQAVLKPDCFYHDTKVIIQCNCHCHYSQYPCHHHQSIGQHRLVGADEQVADQLFDRLCCPDADQLVYQLLSNCWTISLTAMQWSMWSASYMAIWHDRLQSVDQQSIGQHIPADARTLLTDYLTGRLTKHIFHRLCVWLLVLLVVAVC